MYIHNFLYGSKEDIMIAGAQKNESQISSGAMIFLLFEKVDKKRSHGTKRLIHLLKRLMKNILHLVVVYEVLIKQGSGDRILKNCRTLGYTRSFRHWIFHGILQKRVGESIPYAEASRDYVCKTSAATSSHVQNLHITETTI